MAGVRIDSEALAEYAVELNKTLNDLEGDIRRLADEPSLNVNSARQLGEVLFGKLRIAEKPKMTKTKQFSTEEEYLQTFAHKYEIVDKILEYRGVKKLLSTYVEALPLLVNPATGKIHTSFNQAVTATGRLSSTNPNLQNIPVRDELGRRIRKAFIPSDDEHLLLSADYSQVELRLMAHLSGDESLIAAFEHGEDVHAATAARLFGKEVAEVDSDERRKAKTANFGIIYGISAFGLSQRLDIPRKEAKEIIEGYFASYPKVKEYMDRVVEEAKRDGYVSTIFGRRRYLNDIASRNAVARGRAKCRERSDSGKRRRHHEDRHDLREPPVPRGGHPLEGDPAGARRVGGRYASFGAGARHRHRYRGHGVRRCAARAAGGGLRRGRQLARSALMPRFDRIESPAARSGGRGFYLESACGRVLRTVVFGDMSFV